MPDARSSTRCTIDLVDSAILTNADAKKNSLPSPRFGSLVEATDEIGVSISEPFLPGFIPIDTIDNILTDRVRAAIAAVAGVEAAPADPQVSCSTNPRFGDYQANAAMALAKRLKKKPRDVAQGIVDHLDVDGLCDRVEIAGPGFINLHLETTFLESCLVALARDTGLAVAAADPPQTVVVDYSSPNMAKEMHVGHLRSSCIGDSIVRLLEAAGHRVIRQNHLGDWGTQFGMLLEHLIDTGWDRTADHSIQDLDELYRLSKKRFDGDPAFADKARQRVVQLQAGDEQSLALWRLMIDESVHHMNAIYARIGLTMTDADIRPESFYNDRLDGVIDRLEADGLLEDSEGAKVVFCEGFADPDGNPLPMIVRKSDGGYLYATTDLAAARFRISDLGADRIIYVTDPRQSQHFAMLFQVLRRSGWAGDAVRLEHVPFGTVLGSDRKPFKTREGGTVKLSAVLDEAEQRAARMLEAKNPDLPEDDRRRIARAVGVGAMKYADLANDRIKDYVFDWNRMLAMEGNTAPYLQNAFVRIESIFRKGSIRRGTVPAERIALRDPAERALGVKLLQYPAVVAAAAENLHPHRICTYAYEVATAFHQFYEKCPVLTAADDATRDARLQLCDLAARILEAALHLLGIDVVEQM